jgi:hypothetical protein
MYKMDDKLKEYFKRFNDTIGETDSADRISEGPWWDIVIKKLNNMSYYCAQKLQHETGRGYRKPYGIPREYYELPYEESPPTRLLSMTLILCYWLGFHDADKGHELQSEEEGGIGAWKRIKKA